MASPVSSGGQPCQIRNLSAPLMIRGRVRAGAWLLAALAFGGCTQLQGGGDAPRCESALPLPKPEGASGGAADLKTLAFALESVSSGLHESEESGFRYAYEASGFDLDMHCSDQGQDPGCVLPPWAGDADDGPGGRDYSANHLAAQTAELDPERVVELELVPRPTTRYTGVLRITGFNGQHDDDEVTVAIHGATWSESPPGEGERDGERRWRPWAEAAGAKGGVVDQDAYVTAGTLVARFPEVLFGAPPIGPFPARQVIVTGRLEETDDGFRLRETQMAGRMGIAVLLEQLALTFQGGEVQCLASGEYEVARDVFCNRVDIRELDNDASKPCDALSFLSLLTWAPVELGPPIAIPVAEAPECPVLRCE